MLTRLDPPLPGQTAPTSGEMIRKGLVVSRGAWQRWSPRLLAAHSALGPAADHLRTSVSPLRGPRWEQGWPCGCVTRTSPMPLLDLISAVTVSKFCPTW